MITYTPAHHFQPIWPSEPVEFRWLANYMTRRAQSNILYALKSGAREAQ
jgi:hypothetical protein